MISYINTDYLTFGKNRFIQSIGFNEKSLRRNDSDLKNKTGDQEIFLFRVDTGIDRIHKNVINFLVKSPEVIDII